MAAPAAVSPPSATADEPPEDVLDAGRNAAIVMRVPPSVAPRPSARSDVRTSRERSRHASSPSSEATAPIRIKPARLYNNGELDAYEMYARPRGHVLIINNEDFSDPATDHKSRVGSQFDAESIRTLFEELYFRVHHYHDLMYPEMKDRIREFAQLQAHKTANACFVFIMSHGAGNRGEDSFISCDGRALAISWVEDQFNNENAPNLHGKPKILVFHCCRGDEYDYGVRSAHHHLRDHGSPEDNGNHESDSTAVARTASIGERLPAVTDMLVVYSTVPGKVSMRDIDRGTWYIQILCRVIREHADGMKLRDILDQASQRLARYQGNSGKMQASEYTVRTFKNFYFNPSIWHDPTSPLQPSGVGNPHMELPHLELLNLDDG